MKTIAVLLALAVCGANVQSLPSLAWIHSKAQGAIDKVHTVNGQTIDLVNSTNQAAASLVKDTAQTHALWLEDGYDKMGDKTKDAIQITQDTANKVLGIVQHFDPLNATTIGSKVVNMTGNVGKTMTNVLFGGAQLGTAAANQAFGATVDTMAQASSKVADKVSAANEMAAHLAQLGVNKTSKVTSMMGTGIGNAIQAVGKGMSSWFRIPSSD